jgi:hypothetical protein
MKARTDKKGKRQRAGDFLRLGIVLIQESSEARGTGAQLRIEAGRAGVGGKGEVSQKKGRRGR